MSGDYGTCTTRKLVIPQPPRLAGGGSYGPDLPLIQAGSGSRATFARIEHLVLPATVVLRISATSVFVVLSDNGREFCGREDRHPYQLFLQLEEIEHRKTKVDRPQSNGFIACFHRTLLDEHLRVKGRTTWYESVEEMQTDLDAYLETYNRNRPHCGRGMEGEPRTKSSRGGSGSPGAGRSQPGRR